MTQMKTAAHYIHSTLRAGFGFDVGRDFARAKFDTPAIIALDEYAQPGHHIAYIAENPDSSLGFLRIGGRSGLSASDPRFGKVRIHARQDAFVTPIENQLITT